MSICYNCNHGTNGKRYSKDSCLDTPVPGYPSYVTSAFNYCEFHRATIWPFFVNVRYEFGGDGIKFEGGRGIQLDPFQVSGYVVLAMGLVIIAVMFYTVLWEKLHLSKESWWGRTQMILIFGLPFYDVTSDLAFFLTTPFVNPTIFYFVFFFIILHPIVFIGRDLYKKGIRLTVLDNDLIAQYNGWISSKGLTYSNIYVSIGWVFICCAIALWNIPMLSVLFIIYLSKWNSIAFMSNWWYNSVTKSDKYHVSETIMVSEYHKSILAELLLETTPMLILQWINISLLQSVYGLYPSPISIISLVISCVALAQSAFRYGYSLMWERKAINDIGLGHLKSDNLSNNVVTTSDVSVDPNSKFDAPSDVEMRTNIVETMGRNEVKMLIKEEMQPLLEELKQLKDIITSLQ